MKEETREEALVLYEALKRLDKNPDFKLLIRNKYLHDSVMDNFSLLAHPAIKRNGERPDVMEELVAKSNLHLFLLNIEMTGKELMNEGIDDLDEPVEAEEVEA